MSELTDGEWLADPADPIIVLVSIGLGQILKRVLPARVNHVIKPYLPVIILLLAVGGRVLYDFLSSGEITVNTALRALAAAGVAVLTHSQFRSIAKVVLKAPSVDDNPRSGGTAA